MGKDWFQKMLNDYHLERKSDLFLKSESFKAIWNYIRDLVETDSVREFIVKTRNKYDIPPSGFLIESETWTNPPKEWVHYENNNVFAEIQKIMREFCLQHHLLPRDWASVFEEFLFYNKFHISLEPNSYNLCFVSDLKSRIDSTGRQTAEEDISTYPIAIHISPYASKRNILDYVEKYYMTEINRLQRQYRDPVVGIGRHRTKKASIRNRNRFLYNNQRMNRKQLVRIVNQRYPEASVDEGSVGKIISIERKRRKEA